ncbi:hypothetical protein BGW38_003186 [Lunasporangiospora selenospora]|uniref:HTH CENPB-type domain-containing protein n=1 Tax=Lunasporangiospora selenospora TaxID=979761 RepID=A0A9P6FS68_9FUNG|nr:hypothetical protein BGW38_003186 [Lunasporangiospora selenospora]
MGVFGEKHTSLTREQKRQLIHQADTHKLRPTEVCDWVLATWGLRIARVTVYSILHKQRASLMAGHKDLYQSMQNGFSGTGTPTSSTKLGFTSLNYSSDDTCLGQNKAVGRINKYRTSSGANSANVGSDRSADGPMGEGARWEGQLKRVREPASVELDRAMVAFLKSPSAVDAHGRRLNDAELQSHALRLAKTIPSASRMRCSFGWLRHFKRRLGVQWAADRLGRYRWIIEMDEDSNGDTQVSSAESPSLNEPGCANHSGMVSSSAVTSASSALGMAHDALTPPAHHRLQAHVSTPRQARAQGQARSPSLQAGSHALVDDDEDDDDEYHSSNEVPLNSHEAMVPHHVLAPTDKHSRPAPQPASSATILSTTPYAPIVDASQHVYRAPSEQLRLHAFTQTPNSPYSLSTVLTQSYPTPSLIQPTHSPLLDFQSSQPSPHPQTPSASFLHTPFPTIVPSTSEQQSTSPSILDSFPNLFESLPAIVSPTAVPSPHHVLLDNHRHSFSALSSSAPASISLSTVNKSTGNGSQTMGLNVDGSVRKIPTKGEAYEMLQSLLLYYEQDHYFLGEQQTLLLPRWIHQQRQIMHQASDNDPRLYWMRQENHPPASSTYGSEQGQAPRSLSYSPQQQQQQYQEQQEQEQTHRALSTASSSPPLSPLSTVSHASTLTPMTSHSTAAVGNTSSIVVSTGSTSTSSGLEHLNASAFSSLTSTIEQQMFYAHHQALQQQFALQQQHQQQQHQQQQQQQSMLYSHMSQTPASRPQA